LKNHSNIFDPYF